MRENIGGALCGCPALIGDPNDPNVSDKIVEFARPDIRDPSRPIVLLLSFEYSSALNLQHVSHDIVFYAPLWGEDPSGVHAAANEQQAIGRVVRIGQAQDVMVHRLLATGPNGQDTIDKRVIGRNTSENVTRQAVNTCVSCLLILRQSQLLRSHLPWSLDPQVAGAQHHTHRHATRTPHSVHPCVPRHPAGRP